MHGASLRCMVSPSPPLTCPQLPSPPAVTQNAFGELCALQKVDGCGLTPPQLMNCIRLATQKVGGLRQAELCERMVAWGIWFGRMGAKGGLSTHSAAAASTTSSVNLLAG